MTAVVEDQEQDHRAALVCHRGPSASYQAEWTYWDSIKQARQAESELTPCGPSCVGIHSAVSVEVSRPATRAPNPPIPA